MEEKKKITMRYKNWRGETALRNIIPKKIEFIATEWHPEEQWCLIAHDLDKDAERSFALKDIISWKPKEEEN